MIKEKGKEICQRVLDTNGYRLSIAKPQVMEYNVNPVFDSFLRKKAL